MGARRWASAAALSVSTVLVSAGCGNSERTAAAPEPVEKAPTTGVTFVDPTTGGNKWFPLKPGTQWVREGTTLVGKREVSHQVISTVTDVVREIDGVKAVGVLDEERGGGELKDKSVDWFAQDDAGNVWWMGATTEAYSGGKSAGLDEAWAAGRGKAERGIFIPADPSTHPSPWRMATPPGEKSERAEFRRVQAKECVPFGCYEGVVVIAEGVATDEVEEKFYAPGVGQIRNHPEKSFDSDVEKLANLTTLSAEGLTEFSTEALRIDALAVEEEPEAYSDVKATRASIAPATTPTAPATTPAP